jgi:MmyB-like transcription regulator ligand binding domain/Helix-turn-helix domain
MDARIEIREFLTTRRARITPKDAGLPNYGGGRRRVSGLRREEVALLAGISVEYYTRLERGDASGASESVLEGVSRALQLDEAERTHLYALVRTANAAGVIRGRPPQSRVRPSVQRILDAMTDVPAFVLNARLDVLAANRLGDAFYSELFADPVRPVNSARFVFLNPGATEFFLDWETVASDTVGILRTEAGRDPYDRRLSDLIGELSTRSEEFRVRWAAHNVKLHRTGVKRFHHPVVGDLTLDFESLDLPGDPGQTLLVYTAEPNSPSQQALSLLGSWTSTPGAMVAHADDEFSVQQPRTEP